MNDRSPAPSWEQMNGSDRSIDALERAVEARRQTLTATLEAVRERVDGAEGDGSSVTAIARERVRSASADALDRVAARVRRRPLGAALIGAGLAGSLWGIARAMPRPLLLIGAGIALVSRSDGARGDRSAATDRPRDRVGTSTRKRRALPVAPPSPPPPHGATATPAMPPDPVMPVAPVQVRANTPPVKMEVKPEADAAAPNGLTPQADRLRSDRERLRAPAARPAREETAREKPSRARPSDVRTSTAKSAKPVTARERARRLARAVQERPFAVGAGGLALGLGLLTSRLLADDRPPAGGMPTPSRFTPSRSATRPPRGTARRNGSPGNRSKPSAGSTRRPPRSAALASGASDAAVRVGRQAVAGRPAKGRVDKRANTKRRPAGSDRADRPPATAPSRSRRPARKPSSPATRTPSTEPTNDR